jgi:hypothetical protein
VFAGSVGKKRRAASDIVAKITLSDLVKYFDMPIVEASKKLNVGLTVLKRKCREFGIPRWPHRKIKSLDSLIHDLQVLHTLPSLFIMTTLPISIERYIHYRFQEKLLSIYIQLLN